jgi:DNA polymerase/3'-5' exonuclease PolX
MELEHAIEIAATVYTKLEPHCSKLEIAGSIRRKKSFVRDIDIVCIPSNQGQFLYALQQLGKIKMGGQKLIRCDLPTGVSLDIYVATPETWATLLLIRTGSKESNIRLCKRALSLGMKLHADGRGLEKCLAGEGHEVDAFTTAITKCDTEESIFEALELPYLPPEKRI